ncbi:MAG: RidA family protein [Acidobacteria bacterium]|nr:RidA family protein [Acidobacteriota bacterium]MBI3421526.1 RidA family protein [Acidobacteriota bacterium]
MSKQHLNPATLFPSLPSGFSQAVVTTPGRIVFLSGQTAWDANKQIVGGNDLGAQTRQALQNVRLGVEAAGGALADVVSLRLYIVNPQPGDTGQVGEALREFFPTDKPPASTWIGVTSLAVPEFLVEIEAIAVLDAA